MTTASARAVIISDNHIMTGPARSPLRRVLGAPFTRRAWAELAYAIVSFLLAVALSSSSCPCWSTARCGPRPRRASGSSARPAASWPARCSARTSRHRRRCGRTRSARCGRRTPRGWPPWPRRGGQGESEWQPGPDHRAPAGPGRRAGRRGGHRHRRLRPESKLWLVTEGRSATGRLAGARLLRAQAAARRARPGRHRGLRLGGLFCLTFPAWWALEACPGFGRGARGLAARSCSCRSARVLLLAAPWLTHGITEPTAG